MSSLLEVSHLKVLFHTQQGDVPAVDDVSFQVEEGETLCIVGESGCGKSATVQAVMKLVPTPPGEYAGGKILLEGRDLLPLSTKEMIPIRGHEMSMIFQEPMTSLNPVKTIGSQVGEVLEIHRRDLSAREIRAQVEEKLSLVGIPDPARCAASYPHQLSGGMRQRVVIAIALACKPQLLICDEPTTALDVTVQAKILELIQDIQKRTGIAVIYITHDLGVVAKIADFVNVMYAGKIVECGTVDDIFYEPRHPYTWGLLSSMPDLDTADEKLYTIPGSPPNLLHPVKGDAFAPRNEYAMAIDFEEEPPMFTINSHHKAATWLLHPQAPKVEMPAQLRRRIDAMLKGGQ